jgi:hypothetical protein
LAALLCAALENRFPTPERSAARLLLREISPDGRAARDSEYLYLDGARAHARICARGPAAGTLNPLHFNQDEIASAGSQWSLASTPDGGTLEVRGRAVLPLPPAPIWSAVKTVELQPVGGAALLVTRSASGAGAVPHHAPPGLTTQSVQAFFGRLPRGGALIRPAGIELLNQPLQPGAQATPGTNLAEYIPQIWPELTSAEAAARVKALSWILARAQASRRTLLLMFDELSYEARTPMLIEVTGARVENGSRFGILLFDTHEK